MEYHAITHSLSAVAVVRTADHGVSDTEWRHGCRIFKFNSPFQSQVNTELLVCGFEIYDNHEWSEFIGSLDEPSNVPNNNFISTRVVYDKWDNNRPIY